jgi:sec-independent protein translocase protein TatC
MQDGEISIQDRKISIIEHLSELRYRLIYSMIAVVVCVAAGWFLVPSFYRAIMGRAPVKMTQMGVTEVFFVQFHLGIWIGIIIASPFILYQFIAFILPALKPNERRLLYGILPAMLGLFVAGFSFSYIFIVPAATRFFISVAVDSGTAVIVSPKQWVDMIMQFSLPLGVVFELPVVVWLLAMLGIATPSRLRKWRKYAVLGAVVVGALISPAPIVVDQIIMAIPLLLLYEVSIVIAGLVERRRNKNLSD